MMTKMKSAVLAAGVVLIGAGAAGPGAALSPAFPFCTEKNGTELTEIRFFGGEGKGLAYFYVTIEDQSFEGTLDCKAGRGILLNSNMSRASWDFWEYAQASERKFTFRQIARELKKNGEDVRLYRSKNSCACDIEID